MDVFKQVSPNEIKTTDNYLSLTGTILAHGKTVGDLLVDYNDAGRLSKLLGRSIREAEDYLHALNEETSVTQDDLSVITKNDVISTGLRSLDEQLGGGVPIGTISEIFGASGCGKSHLISQLAAQSTTQDGDECVYICTEKFLETKRLKEISEHTSANLDNMSYIYCSDLESQDHILFTQLPMKLRQTPNARLVIIDSIAQHLRREGAVITSTYLNSRIEKQANTLSELDGYTEIKKYHEQMLKKLSRSQSYANRSSKSYYLLLLYRHLARLAEEHHVAIVVVNQVSDHTTNPGDSSFYEDTDDALNLDFQNSIIAGWDHRKVHEYLSTADSSIIVNSNDEHMLQYELENCFTNTAEASGTNTQRREYQTSLIEKLSSIREGGVARQVPTLGYTWGKRIPTRILLLKHYKPHLSDVDTDMQINQSMEPNAKPEISSMVKSWRVVRYAKVVSTVLTIYNNMSKIQFKITKTGLEQIE